MHSRFPTVWTLHRWLKEARKERREEEREAEKKVQLCDDACPPPPGPHGAAAWEGTGSALAAPATCLAETTVINNCPLA